MKNTKKFNLTELLNQRSLEQSAEEEGKKSQPETVEKREREEILLVDVEDLQPSKGNFYQVDDGLKRSIELMGILQPLLVKPLENGKYQVIAGHRRRMAVLSLLEEGKENRRQIPCVLKKEDVRDQLALLMANRFRDKTDWERMMEVVEAEKLAKELKKDYRLGGRTRAVLAEMMGMSETQLGRYQGIYKNLDKELMEDFKAGRIGFSAASELCGMPKESQWEVKKRLEEKGTISLPEIRAWKEEKQKDTLPEEQSEGKSERNQTVVPLKEEPGTKEIAAMAEEAKEEEKEIPSISEQSGMSIGSEEEGYQEENNRGFHSDKVPESRNPEGEGALKDLESSQSPGKEEHKRTKPMTMEELFQSIYERLKEKGKLPDILDYGLAEQTPVLIKTCEIDLKSNLAYGSSEGIYLDLWLEFSQEGEEVRKSLGTFKTLRTDEKAMHLMAGLLADFILEKHAYVREHRDDFTWEGVDVYPMDHQGKKLLWRYSCESMEDALKTKEELLMKYLCVVVRDNATRRETAYYPDDTGRTGKKEKKGLQQEAS